MNITSVMLDGINSIFLIFWKSEMGRCKKPNMLSELSQALKQFISEQVFILLK
jgi:hypothetical protein